MSGSAHTMPPPVEELALEDEELELDEPIEQMASYSTLRVWNVCTVVSQLAGSTSEINAICEAHVWPQKLRKLVSSVGSPVRAPQFCWPLHVRTLHA